MIHKHATIYTKGFSLGKVFNRKILDVTLDRDIQPGLSLGLYLESSRESPVFIGVTLFGVTAWISFFEKILEN